MISTILGIDKDAMGQKKKKKQWAWSQDPWEQDLSKNQESDI